MRLLLFWNVLLILPATLAAQTTGSSAVSGTVRDDSGAIVPDCKVVLVETGRALARDASFNVAHRAVASAIYDLPFGRGRAFGRTMSRVVDLAAGGWTVTSIASFATGTPVSLSAANTTGASNITQRPNRICAGGSSDLLGNLRNNGFLAFDTSCFTAPPVGYFGNSGRNPVTGPGINNWDLGFQKYFTLREQTRLEFRGELFNAFNHAQFGQPNASIANGANFGRISTASPPRLIQLSMKLLF